MNNELLSFYRFVSESITLFAIHLIARTLHIFIHIYAFRNFYSVLFLLLLLLLLLLL